MVFFLSLSGNPSQFETGFGSLFTFLCSLRESLCTLRQLRCALLLGDGGDKRLRQLALAALLDIEVPYGTEHHRTDEVHEQIPHGVVQPDVQVSAEPQLLPVYRHRGDAVDGHGDVAVGGIQHHRGDGVHHRVLLHIHHEQPVHAELEELPQYAHGHGEAERRHSHIDRGQLKLDLAVAVENVDEREPRGGAQKSRGGVQHGVPVRIGDEVALQLAQYLRCENKQQYDDLQRGRQLDAEVLLDKKRQDKQSQYQQADKRALIFAADDGRHQRSQYDQPQYGVYGEHGGLPPDDGLQLRAQVPRGLFLTFHSVSLSACHFHFPVLYRKIRRNTIKMTARPDRADLRQASRVPSRIETAPRQMAGRCCMRLLLCAENAVAGIAQTGHDVAVLVQVIVQRTGIDVHIRVQLLDVFDALGSRHQHH